MRAIFTICLAATSLLGILLDCRADSPVEGSAPLVDVVLAAHQTNKAACAQGSLDAEVSIVIPKLRTLNSIVHLEWDGEDTYWEYERVEDLGKSKTTQTGEIIETRTQRIFWDPKAALLQIAPKNVYAIHEDLDIHPHRIWFQFDRSQPLTNYLDPKAYRDPEKRYVISEKGDIVVIERYFSQESFQGFQVSLQHGANVVAYETTIPKGRSIWRRGRFDWKRDPDGVWYVGETKLERSFAGSAQEIDHSFFVKINSFSTKPSGTRNRFARESISLPPGAKVEEYGPDGKLRRTYRIHATTALTQKVLDELADAVKAENFATGKR